MAIDPMTKMNISLIAIALMFVCNFLIVFARRLKQASARFLLKALAFLLLIAVFFMILLVVFA